MVFQSDSGIERNRTLQAIVAGTLILAVCAFLLYTKLNKPGADSADGVYVNKCCSIIIINNGRLSYNDKSIDMKLLNMKFGLTGYVDAKFSSEGLVVSNESTSILFSNKGEDRILSVPIDQIDRTFQAVKPPVKLSID